MACFDISSDFLLKVTLKKKYKKIGRWMLLLVCHGGNLPVTAILSNQESHYSCLLSAHHHESTEHPGRRGMGPYVLII